ncbi:hypothetical protein FRC02_004949 [Tulasnella sp. 418]|nr:hypothetical protein FRC02_004949 [Tulasnella sp. 418]
MSDEALKNLTTPNAAIGQGHDNLMNHFSTLALHADDTPNELSVSPAISLSTTFKHLPGQTHEEDVDLANPSRHFYSRYTTPVSVRVEKVLSKIMNGHALTYSSGLAAATAAIIHYAPKRIAITGGYMGVHGIIDIVKRINKDLVVIDLDDDYQPGDLCWVETPLNPTGEARDLAKYAAKIHAVGGKLVCDATFGPPPLQDPFQFGVDCIMHSGTKYLGGHSDLLCGVLVVKTINEWRELINDRVYLGSTMGSLESWLLLRSLRTLHLRVQQQSQSATELARWFQQVAEIPAGEEWDGVPGGIVQQVMHTSLQKVDQNGFNPEVQMPGGFSPTFSIWLRTTEMAQKLPFEVKLFTAATSLGGVESLMEQRVVSDPASDPRLVRLSIGLEGVEDLKHDLRLALKRVQG